MKFANFRSLIEAPHRTTLAASRRLLGSGVVGVFAITLVAAFPVSARESATQPVPAVSALFVFEDDFERAGKLPYTIRIVTKKL